MLGILCCNKQTANQGPLILIGLIGLLLGSVGHRSLAMSSFGGKSLSRQRSSQGRLIVWHVRAPLLKQYPLLGFGGDTSGLVGLATRSMMADRPFNALSYNVLLNVALSTGMLGTFAAVGFVIGSILLLARSLIGGRELQWWLGDAVAVCVVITCAILRDMTADSLVSHGPSTIVAFALLGVVRSFSAPRIVTDTRVTSNARMSITRLFYLCAGTLCLIVGLYGMLYFLYIDNYAYDYGSGSPQNINGGSLLRSWFLRVHPNPVIIEAKGMVFARNAITAASEEGCPGSLAGNVVVSQEYLRKAAVEFAMATDLSPFDPLLHINLGWTHYYRGDHKGSEEQFLKAIKADPSDVAGLVSLATVYKDDGDFHRAEVYYARAVTIAPSLVRSSALLCLRRQNSTLYYGAVQDARDTLLGNATSAISKARLGSIDLSTNRVLEATQLLREAVEELPGLSEAWANLGTAELLQNQPQLAYADLQRSLSLDPGNVTALTSLADFYTNSDELMRAAEIKDSIRYQPISSAYSRRTFLIYAIAPFDQTELFPASLWDALQPVPIVPSVCKMSNSNDGSTETPTEDDFATTSQNSSVACSLVDRSD
jgi:tetratricopeptide (TPR) repeat protein